MSALKRLFSEGFRVFFLAAGLFATLSMAVWSGWLGWQFAGGGGDLPVGPAPQLWHAHEMIFGYGAAALGGFFLTAVPNWTGARAAPHLFITGVALIWLAGRIAMAAAGVLPPLLVAVLDLAFVPVLAAKILTQLLHRPKPQQMVFLLTLTLFWAADLACHLEWLGLAETGWAGLRAGLAVLAAMIIILGGRVTPGFTRNAMVQSGRESRLPWNPPALALLAGGAAVAVPVALLAGLPDWVAGGLAVLAGVVGLIRLAFWRGGWTAGKPILWALHLGYGLTALGLALTGLSWAGVGSELAGLHLLGIGGAGGMTLAIMSRATLGHTGRALVAPRPVAVAYGLIPLAAALRVLGAVLPDLHDVTVLLAGGIWVLAFGLYLLALWPVFLAPRLARGGAA